MESRYSRLERIAWWDQKKLSAARVLVVGAGALGNEILKNLALLGVGRILVVDFDRVELTNLTRSVLFRQEDLGKAKVDVVAQRLPEINPDVRVLPILGDMRWTVGHGLVRRMDLVLGGLDSVAARMAVNAAAWRTGIPWIDGAIDALSGSMRVFVPPDGACFECTLSAQDYREYEQRYSCQLLPRGTSPAGSIPTTPTIASVIAGWQVQEAVKLLHGKEVARSQGLFYHGEDHRFYRVSYRPKPGCLGHDLLPPISRLVHLTNKMSVRELLAALADRFDRPVTVELDRELILGIDCPACGAQQPVPKPLHTAGAGADLCPQCGTRSTLRLSHRLDGSALLQEMSLDALGIPALHILTARDAMGATYPFELSGDAREGALAEFLGDPELGGGVQ